MSLYELTDSFEDGFYDLKDNVKNRLSRRKMSDIKKKYHRNVVPLYILKSNMQEKSKDINKEINKEIKNDISILYLWNEYMLYINSIFDR